MKISSLLLAATAATTLSLSACVSTDRELGTSSKDPRATYTPPATADRTRLNSNSVLNTVRASHAFSEPGTPDNFVLQLRGPRVLTAQAHLFVINSKGDTISHQVMPARTLINDQALNDPQAATVRDKEIAILQGMNSFFAPARFSQPAVPTSAQQPAEVDTKAWQALREDPTAVAFDFTGRDGSEQRLAYARKLGKAVIITQ